MSSAVAGAERARPIRRRASVAGQQLAENVAAVNRLRAGLLDERDIAAALQPAGHVPVGQAVADIPGVAERGGVPRPLTTLTSGASDVEVTM